MVKLRLLIKRKLQKDYMIILEILQKLILNCLLDFTINI